MASILNSFDAGASAQSATNANGSTATTITYPDGSTVTLTTPPAGSSSSSAGTSATGTGATNQPASGPTLEGLIATQASALSSQALLAELTGSVNGQGGAQQNQLGQNTSNAGGSNSSAQTAIGVVENLLSMATNGDTGATSATAQNTNGSTTTTITYADGSTLAMTSAAPSSAGASQVAGGTNTGAYQLIEQMIQLQAQLLNPAGTSTTTTTA